MKLEDIASSPFAIGALGSVVALKFAPGLSWLERATNVGSGALIAGYGAPAVNEYLRVTTPGLVSGCAFILGLVGMSLVASVLQAVRDLKLGDIVSWITRR